MTTEGTRRSFRLRRDRGGSRRGSGRRTSLYTHLQKGADRRALDTLYHFVEHIKAFLFIGNNRVNLTVCTKGNTLSKLAKGIYDTPVTLAVKSHLRNSRNVLIGVSTNDALSGSAENIGKLLNRKHFYFIPLSQDDFRNKPFSLVCDFEKTFEAALSALESKQLQPMLS